MKNIDLAIRAAIKAGHSILEIYSDPNSDFSVEKKADNSPLTIADKASHNVIVSYLDGTDIPVLSEEGTSISYNERKHWSTFWLIDPLDGTKEFIKKNGEFTVNIALIKEGNPVMGVIYVPVSRMLYVGIDKKGAWKIEVQNADVTFEEIQQQGLRLPQPSTNQHFTIVGSRSHMSAETEAYIEELKNEHAEIDIVSKGSSLKICMVAEGIANEYPRFGPTMEWDTAAGHAIANAAGKKLWLTDLSNELCYNKENLLNPFFIVK